MEPTLVTETMAYPLASDPDGNVIGLLEGEEPRLLRGHPSCMRFVAHLTR